MQRLQDLWREIKRRNVHRSLAIYAGTAFLILEASDIIFPRWGLPDYAVDIVLYLLLFGAVITVVVSWIFDVTPKGVEITKPLSEASEETKPGVAYGWKLTTYLSLVIIAALIIYNLSERFKGSGAGIVQSLVILPFDNFTGDDELEYVVAGMHSSLIGDMGHIGGLRVISKTSANTYRDKDKSIPEIASELTVDAVVETTITCVGEKICAQFKLVSSGPEEEVIWSKNYETAKSNILNLNNWVIRDIADEIDLQMTSEQQTELKEERQVNLDAYDYYLRGKFNLGFLTRESQMAAIEYFNKALEIDPELAEAYAGIAGAWAVLKQMDYVSPDEANPEIRKYMARAMEFETASDEIYYYNGITKIWTDFDWEEGESSLRKCLEINPSFSEARAYYSHLMMLLKRPDEMREQMQLALQNDPKNLLIKVLATVELYVELKFDSCINQAFTLQKMMPNNPLLMLALFLCYTETGQYELAINELTKVFGQLADENVIQTLQETYRNTGFKEALLASADEWIARSDFVSPQHAIMLYAYGGDEEKMLYWLDRGYIRNDPSNPYLGVQPYLRFYHDNPRYTEILERLNLPLGPFIQ